ncbi:cupin domain-containing protein [Paracraurococcus lichenis]|uniref:Cupin domain-containing protein n=1 Tax=Paracraurococcus lichenis TaxID=3064888 RepID=A0ABT9E164_9PROT|nr:cupin domain-containing protein [Paracraurococcus sp. LOR1-02]MDO9709889.1 cupin domain-containing protein [Paracraurococcus sp. LOR1-02]
MTWETKRLSDRPEAMAPDGSEVRILAGCGRGSLAQFTLPPGAVSRAVRHRTVEEVWYVLSGRGRMWRAAEGREEVVELVPGLSLSIPVGTRFQFRADGDEPLTTLGTTMPPWPGEAEAIPVEGIWPPTL